MAVVAPSHGAETDGGLYAVWVDPNARGAGAGRALLEAAIEAATHRGYHRLVLEVGDHNAPAIALYARMGFEVTGETCTLAPPRTHITEHERARKLTPAKG